MATYSRQFVCLLKKNIIFKYRCKQQTITEVLAVLLLPTLAIIWKEVIYRNSTHEAISSSKQKIYNASEIPDLGWHHLAYVTNVNAS